MAYEIDQSGKIEQTNKNTILCLSNDEKWDAIFIKGKTKRQLQEIFRRHGQIRNFIIFTFSAGLAILLKRNSSLPDVIVDDEYTGKGHIIKNIVKEMLKEEKKIPNIIFRRIGKKALAHHRAYAIGLGKLKAKKIIEKDVILRKIEKTEVGKRLKDA